MKRAFSLVELMMVVALLGILAAMAMPQFQSYTTNAKASTAKANLRVLRSAIELYTAHHAGIPPGYQDGNPLNVPSFTVMIDQLKKATTQQGAIAQLGTVGYDRGPYLKTSPENPFNSRNDAKMITNNQDFPQNATGQFGWIYHAESKTIRLDWPGTDKQGVPYYDY
jgi:prepilin-type N-terminal cleavage/methylation domain-containing protein